MTERHGDLTVTQKPRSRLTINPLQLILPISVLQSSTLLTRTSGAGTCTCGRMSMLGSIPSSTLSPSRTSCVGNSCSSLMGGVSGATGRSSTCPPQFTRKPRERNSWSSSPTIPVTAKDMITGQTCGSQGDPIVGRSISGATFVGPIQVNLGYRNSVSQKWMLSMGAKSSILCPCPATSALNAPRCHPPSHRLDPRSDWVSQTTLSHAGLIGSNCAIFAALLIPLADKR